MTARPATGSASRSARLVVVLFLAGAPLTHLAHAGARGGRSGPLRLAFAPIGLVIAVNARATRSAGLLARGRGSITLDATMSLYVVAAYHHHALPLGSVALLLQPSWAPAIVLFGVAVQLFPPAARPGRPLGRSSSGRTRHSERPGWSPRSRSPPGCCVHGRVRVGTGGDLLQLDHPTGAYAFWGVLQNVFFIGFGLMFVAWLVRELPGLPARPASTGSS